MPKSPQASPAAANNTQATAAKTACAAANNGVHGANGALAITLEDRLGALGFAASSLLAVRSSDLLVREGEARLTSSAIDALPTAARETLRSLELDLERVSLRAAVERLEAESSLASESSADLLDNEADSVDVFTIDGTFLPMPSPNGQAQDDFVNPEGGKIPTGSGLVRPAGILPLMKVLQHIKRYEAGEVAHAENMLKSESKSRETRRLHRTEETFLTESERTIEQERDEQTTERHEMQREVGETISEREKFNIGASISGGYGPFVQAEFNTAFESETTTEETQRAASTYAREVTEETVSRVTERVREQRTRTTIDEFEEKYLHGFDNTNGTGHVTGIYQWLDKIYQMEVRNYGQRLLFDVKIPEPSALYLHVLTQVAPDTGGLKRPKPFTRTPDQITLANYKRYVHRYRVTAVEPPPPLYKTLSIALKGEAQLADENQVPPITEARDVDVPTGYRAVEAFVRVESVSPPPVPVSGTPGGIGPASSISILVGRKESTTPFEGELLILDDESGDDAANLPIALTAQWTVAYSAAIEILCRRTSRELENWRLRTHEAIMQAYLQLEAAYQEKLAALAAASGVTFEGRSPLENSKTIRDELQRAAISILTGQHFDKFSAILESDQSPPEIDFDEAVAEGEYVAFFNQSFEWENLVYLFYPYFWGRKQHWAERLLTRDVDPNFAAFLTAGYARLQIPVRPGFESAVLAFLDSGEIPQGDTADVVSPDHLSIAQDLKAQLGVAGEGALVESFEIRLPTTLHVLRHADSLPAWEQSDDGQWIPVPLPAPAEDEDGDED
jgi:hypothetical protein